MFIKKFDLKKLTENKPSPSILRQLIKEVSFFIPMLGENPRIYSKNIDKILGFKIPKIEQELLKKYRAYYKSVDHTNKKGQFKGTQTWIGLHPQALQTPYCEIVDFLSLLKKFTPKTIIDFGAGYGRIGIVLNSILPNSQFIGYEILSSRIREAERMFRLLGVENHIMISQNILDPGFKIPCADVYFVYDFSDIYDLRILLKKLSDKLYKDRFFIVAKGEGIRSLIQLKYPQFWIRHGAIHRKNWSIYSSFQDLN